MTKFKERIAGKELNEAYERIRELEALVNANTDHMTEVGVELCRERDARIAKLEDKKHELTLRLNDQRTTAAALRKVASEAEAALAPLKKLYESRGEYIGELEAALAERDRMLGLAAQDWVDSQTRFADEEPQMFDDWLADLRARAEEGRG